MGFLVLSVIYLALLECLLSVDNALALAALVHGRLSDPKERDHALKWGVAGAYLIRLAVIAGGAWLMAHAWVKALAGAYLIFLAAKGLRSESGQEEAEKAHQASTLLRTIVAVELLDLAFSIDSVVVTLSVSERFEVLAGGAVLGIALMRFAAGYIIKLIDRFPVLETVAFILVGLAGIRILAELAGYQVPEAWFAGGMLALVGGTVLLSVTSGRP